ncbi:MAG: hypothetical protein KF887_04905 [Paracoccaceae bacterium]|nr:MAG: hypothetical protein KF887_04905 [Paracoccaceae bacterium]
MGNALAYAMLAAWPLLAWALYSRLPPARALIWAILLAYMLLPPEQVKFDLPAIPDMDKFSISNLCALIFTLLLLRERVPVLPPGPVSRVLLLLFVISPFATAVTNPDPISIYLGDVPALRAYDAISYVAGQLIALIPFFLARRFLGTDDGMRMLVQALVTAGLIYSLPMLLEARLSPQLNTWIYGFFQHDFSQSMRGGGFRPMVFMPHGLWVAFFALMAAMSALVLLRDSGPEERPKRLVIWLYLMLVLTQCRSLGPLAYALGLTPVILFAPRRVQLLLGAALAVIVITYPFLRGAHLVPLDDILAFAKSISTERHQSLEYRILNEEQLLARAQEKFWFGWGGYGRSLILDPYDGRILSVPDGGWIIVLGTYGWLGYAAMFGMLVLPLLMLGREAILSKSLAFSRWGCAVALIYAANLVDLLPNDTIIPFTWLMGGALMAWAEGLARARRERAQAEWAATLPQGRRTAI